MKLSLEWCAVKIKEPMASLDHQTIATHIARYFYRFLLEELEKPNDQMDSNSFHGQLASVVNQSILDRLLKEFAEIPSLPEVPYNFIRRWVDINNQKMQATAFNYDTWSFARYSVIFIERLLHYKYASAESLQCYRDAIIYSFSQFDYQKWNLYPSYFLSVENIIREILRDIISEIPNIDQRKAIDFLFTESNEYQLAVSQFFEEELKEAVTQSERLLHNILPPYIAEELKQKGKVAPVHIPSATVLFTDFVGFTQISESISPQMLINELDHCFSLFDQIIETYELEKIKTIGDAYMCVGGLGDLSQNHATLATQAALAMRDTIHQLKKAKTQNQEAYWDIRIGLHTGPLIAGVIGHKKFSYDVWGDTVNTASRMESFGKPGYVTISEAVYEQVKDLFQCELRGNIDVKGKGKIPMYFVYE